MGRSLWDTASGRDRRWGKRSGGDTPAPGYVRVVVIVLAAVLGGTFAWEGIQALLHPVAKFAEIKPPGSANYVARGGATPGGPPVGAWEADVAEALQTATTQGSTGNITTSEVLLPPSTRNFNDNVRVEGLTIEGASQPLDGVRWKNVTFIGMRLRYEG